MDLKFAKFILGAALGISLGTLAFPASAFPDAPPRKHQAASRSRSSPGKGAYTKREAGRSESSAARSITLDPKQSPSDPRVARPNWTGRPRRPASNRRTELWTD